MKTFIQKVNHFLVECSKRILAYNVSDVLNLPKPFVWVDDTQAWRWALRKRRIQRWFIYKAWQQYIPNLRWLILLFVALVTFWAVTKFLPLFDITKVAELKHPADATLLLALIGSPIAYVIWWFRDANARQQIENQRKDVNLKDFQRLAEWAAGMHLPENKITTSEKTINSETKDAKPKSTENKTSTSNEILSTTETSAIPAGTVIHTHSRREGAASLQIAAIYQLQAFLQGEYGRYFQRPAFQLLKSIWLALVSQHLADLEGLMQEQRGIANKKEQQTFKKTLDTWRVNLQTTMNSPIGKAITVALGAQQGWLLRTHQADLPNAILSGYNSNLAALKQPLELDGLDLTSIKMQGANLFRAQLQCVDLSHAELQSVILLFAKLQSADLYGAQLQGADLRFSQLKGANLRSAQLQGADLFAADLQRADFRGAKLEGTNLFQAKLEGADLSNIVFSAETQFGACYADVATQVLITEEYGITKKYVNVKGTYERRQELKTQGLVLPAVLYQQLYAEPTAYEFKNKQGKLETRHDVGLFSSFE